MDYYFVNTYYLLEDLQLIILLVMIKIINVYYLFLVIFSIQQKI